MEESQRALDEREKEFKANAEKQKRENRRREKELEQERKEESHITELFSSFLLEFLLGFCPENLIVND